MIENSPEDKETAGCAGVLQIKKIFVDEVNRILGEQRYSYDDRFSPKLSIEMVRTWIDDRMAHNPEWDSYDLALAYNAGDKGSLTPKTSQMEYARLVRNLYNSNQTLEVPPEYMKDKQE